MYACLADCAYGIASDPITGCSTCKCEACPAIKCADLGCTTSYSKDPITGCPTCGCLPDPTVCKPIACDLACKSYKVDPVTGCKLCACADPIFCPAVLCAEPACTYGTLTTDFSSGCPGCPRCSPCPKISCSLVCDPNYGFEIDPITNCEICSCRKEPICKDPATVSVTSSITFACDLDCKYFKIVDGCKTCVCAEPVCTCGDKKSDPITCPDKTTISDYSICNRSDPNLCYWTRNPCPIGIVVVMKDGTFAADDLQKFLIDYRVSATDVKISDAVINKDGKQEITLWVKKETIPSEKTAGDVALDVEKSIKADGTKDSYAFVLSENTNAPSSSSTLIISILALLLLVLA